jgi:anaerobic dimethyl sulfoxide reductase subunit B (iron-sulfur subunit)
MIDVDANNMGKKGFYYNEEACVGCRTCQIACKDKNQLPLGVLFRRVESYETGQFPNVSVFNFAATCNHCEHPVCVRVCPTSAMYSDEVDGTVQHDDPMCIGCQYCVNACPYGNPRYLSGSMVVHKCNACVELRTSGEQVACVAACPMRALEFGELDELRIMHPEATNALPILPSPEQTSPSLLISARPSALQGNFQRQFF